MPNTWAPVRCAFLILTLSLAPSLPAAQTPRVIGFEERVAAQRAIDEVFWRHRIWPSENPEPKPGLSEVMPDESIRAKVEDSLRASAALDSIWQRPITTEQLQTELERMAKNTRDPAMLRELFDALGGDPALIAETLARPTLADRLTRSLYSSDPRFHGAVRLQAEQALARATANLDQMRSLGGEYSEATRDRGSNPERTIGRLGPLVEDEEGFSASAVLSLTKESVTTATVRWRKNPFDSWWSENRAGFATKLPEPTGPFSTVTVTTATACQGGHWTSIAGGAPSPFVPSLRYSHSAVWTGSEMIVWGGVTFTGYSVNTGARYNPATDSWTPTSIGSNVPGPRYKHLAIWTGSRMIVWGGSGAGGGRYDPATDTWLPVATSSSPGTGSVVWTGSLMIVWGGSHTQTGGRYDPVSNTWSPTSTGPEVPSRRQDHTAVWTGSEMIVWGGYDSTLLGSDRYLDSGGRYDPASDTWRTTLTGPSRRRGHTAVWTGSRMVVWGGGGARLRRVRFPLHRGTVRSPDRFLDADLQRRGCCAA